MSDPRSSAPPEGAVHSGDEPLPRAAFATVWLTLFLDLVGFGIVIPVLPYYAMHFGASATVVTLLSTTFSLAQFAMSPVLGALGDRHGRRRVMLISIAGSCASLLILGFAQALWMVFAARLLNGMCNANVSTAHAYVADRVAPHLRAKYMGMMGAAIGLGFVFGPAIGGLLASGGHPERPFLVASALAAVNWILAFRFLPESLPPGPQRAKGLGFQPGRIRRMLGALTNLRRDPLGWLVLVNLLFFSAFSSMESTFALLMDARFGWTEKETGYLFTLIGVFIVLTQGVAVGRMAAWIGERRALLIGMLILSLGLGVTGWAPLWPIIVAGAAGIAIGNGLVTPNVNAMVSRASGAHEQGLNLGVTASAGSLGRIVGPIAAGPLFEHIAPGVPMFVACGLVLAAAVLVATGLRIIDPEKEERAPGPAESA